MHREICGTNWHVTYLHNNNSRYRHCSLGKARKGQDHKSQMSVVTREVLMGEGNGVASVIIMLTFIQGGPGDCHLTAWAGGGRRWAWWGGRTPASPARSPGCTGGSPECQCGVHSEQWAMGSIANTGDRVLRSKRFVRKLVTPRAEWRRHGEQF